jgi:hypothetical protein
MPIRLRTADTVDGGRSSTSAISGPLNRSRRSAAMTCTVRSSVRLATRLGADQRSARPATPSARKRATHFEQVRHAHFGRRGGLRDRRALLDDPRHHPLALSE